MYKMKRNDKIDMEILRFIRDNPNKGYDSIIDGVFKKFMLSNFFRIHKIYRVDIWNRMLDLEEREMVKIR